MIAGIGIDIIETDRVASKIAKGNGFKEYVFSGSEITYCEKNKNKAEHYAARFAAKEALIKAFGTGFSANYALNEMEIINDTVGRPSFSFKGETKINIEAMELSQINLSMSHLENIACAIVVIEK